MSTQTIQPDKAPNRSEVERLFQSANTIHSAACAAYAGACLTGNRELIDKHRTEAIESLEVLLDRQYVFLRDHWSF